MDYDDADDIPRSLLREGLRRREPSGETGVDDFDLGDYATRFQTIENTLYPPDSYVTHSSGRPGGPTSQHRVDEVEEYPAPPVLSRPFSVNKYPSFSPPRSPSIAHNYAYPSPKQYPISPKSLPTFLAPLSPSAATRFAASQGSLAIPRTPDTESDMDISHFPAYSRTWYEKPSWNDLPGGHHAGSSSKQSNHSGLPWDTNFNNGSSSVIDPITKRERIRMLEQDFGKDAEEAVRKTGPIVGSVDANGNLITSGPKKRTLTRWSQALLALLGGASAIYGALFIKPKSGPAPPASTPPAFVLYAAFVLSFCLSVYLFVLRPCCGKRNKIDPNDPAGNGMFVLPVQGYTGGQKKKRKKGQGSQQGDVHINLIIDPRMLQQGDSRAGIDGEDDLSTSHASTSQTQQSRNRRRTVFEGFALEKQWERARSFLKKLFASDIACLIAWCAVFVYVLFGKKCPPGQFDGWCTSYNIAIACSCFLCIAFGCSVFFDIVDLHASRISPRTRT